MTDLTPYLNRIICGDCLEVMRGMPDGCVQCCVTSPPYWGLRDYGVDGQLGLEQTPEEYVAKLMEVFREVRRVLRGDGICWVNLGDSYNAAGRIGHGTRQGVKQGTNRASAIGADYTRPSTDSLKPKDLVGIPWRVAFALQADGWYLRQDIIWHKPNPMPESVTDRCTKAHEYLFLLSKSAKYYWDAEAIKEPVSGTANKRQRLDGSPPSLAFKMEEPGKRNRNNSSFQSYMKDLPPENGRNKRSVWTIPSHPFPEAHFATFPTKLIEPCILAGSRLGDVMFDPFMGAGTTAVVAANLGRQFIGIDISHDYCRIAEERIARERQQLNMFHTRPA